MSTATAQQRLSKRERRHQLRLLAQVLGRETHVVVGTPQLLPSHLHTTLLLDEGPASPLLARARAALTGRPWLKLTNRPPTRGGQRALLAVLEHGGVSDAIAWSPNSRTVATPGKPPEISLFGSSEDRQTSVQLWRAPSGERQAMMEVDSFQIHALEWSPDGRTLASGDDNAVRLWDEAGLPQSVFEAGEAWVVTFSPNGKLLASGGRDGLVRVWTRDEGRPLIVAEHADRVTALAWSPDGRFLASACKDLDDKYVHVWAGMTAEAITLSEHQLGVSGLEWSPSGSALASAEVDRVRLWFPSTGEEVTLDHGSTNVLAIAWSPCGALLASGDYDGLVRLWNVATRECRTELDGRGGQVRAVAWSPDRATVASGSWDGGVRLWDPDEGGPAAVLEGHTGHIKSLVWSPNGSTLASASVDGVRLWDPERATEPVVPEGHGDDVVALAWSPDGAVLASAGGMHDNTVRLWQSTTGTPRAVLQAHTWLFPALAWSPDGKVLAHAGPTGPVSVWDAEGVLQSSFEWHDSSVDIPHVAWAPGGSTLAVAGGQDDTRIQLWDPAKPEPLAVFDGHGERVQSLAWAPDGSVLASASKGDVWLWEWAADDSWALGLADAHGVGVELAWSPDGSKLASTDEDSIWVWDPITGEEYAARVGAGALGVGVARLCWSPDGRMLAVGRSDGSIWLWDAVERDEHAVLEGHAGSADALAWSPGGALLASGCSDVGSSDDRTVRVWDAARGTCLAVAYCLSTKLTLQFDASGALLRVADGGGSTGNRPIPYLFELSNSLLQNSISPRTS